MNKKYHYYASCFPNFFLQNGELCDKEYELEEIDESHGEVKVVGMEMTACCEGGQKCSRPTTPTFPAHNRYK